MHVRLSMVLSIVVHMKNSLIRYMDYESREKESEQKMHDGNKSVLTTPARSLIYSDIFKDLEEKVDEKESVPQSVNKNINMMMIHDDASYFDLLTKKMRMRGVRIIDFPSG